MNNTFSLEQLFGERLLRVPDYQRGYAWETSHRQEFLQDLELLGADRHHYTGTVVLHAHNLGDRALDEEGRSYAGFDVVDGQQRITTAVVLLDAVRRAFASAGNQKLADGIRKGYVAVPGFDGQPLYRLRLNRDCRVYFEEVVLAERPAPGAPAIRSHERLSQARQEFDEFLQRQQTDRADDYVPWLLGLYRKLTQQLRFTLYEVDSAADVGVIFEVMNNRGKPLSELEKAKNYLLYLSTKMDFPGDELAERINRTWADIFERLMVAGLTNPADENQLLRVHWITAYDHDARKWSGSDSIKAAFSLAAYTGRHRELLDALTVYARTLGDAAVAFCDAHAPSIGTAFAAWGERRAQVEQLGERLLRMRAVATFLPLLVAVRLRHPDDATKYAQVVDFCERYAFRVYRVRGRRADAGRSNVNWTAHQMYRGELDFEDALARMYGALKYYCSDAEFREGVESVGNWYGWRGLKYLLYAYEEHLAGRHAVRISWREIDKRDLAKTIEHILPQTPTDEYWTKRFTGEEQERWTHDLGNLVLTLHNAELSNRAFPKKKGTSTQESPCYANSVLFQERALERFDDWNAQTLGLRRQQIVDWAADRWAIPAQFAQQPADAVEDDLDEEE